MKKPLLITGAIALGLVLLTPLLGGVRTLKVYYEAIAFTALFVSLGCLFIGVVALLVSVGTRKLLPVAQSLLIVGGLLMLLSFTLCSTGMSPII